MHHSIWARTDDKFIQKTIDKLSSKFGTPDYRAHITILSGINNNDANRFFEDIEFEPFQLVFNSIKTDGFSLLLEGYSSNAYDLFSIEAQKVFGGIISKPHLSLMYYPHDIVEATRIVQSVFKFPYTVLFNAIELWDTKGWLETHPIESWRKLLTKRKNII